VQISNSDRYLHSKIACARYPSVKDLEGLATDLALLRGTVRIYGLEV